MHRHGRLFDHSRDNLAHRLGSLDDTAVPLARKDRLEPLVDIRGAFPTGCDGPSVVHFFRPLAD